MGELSRNGVEQNRRSRRNECSQIELKPIDQVTTLPNEGADSALPQLLIRVYSIVHL
jgi:hypothetical protein